MVCLSGTLRLRCAALSAKINQIAALIKVSILKATHSKAECSVVGVHGGIAADEDEVARIGTTHRTAPIEAAGTDKAERTTAVGAVARHGQLKRGGKSTHRCTYTPT